MSKQFDVLIEDVSIVDGTGKSATKGSIAIKGEKIAAVGEVQGDAPTVVDGAGLVASPGFIDPHSHLDITVLLHPLAENLVMQGITTCIAGNCGHCLAPVNDPKDVWTIQVLGYDIDFQWRTFGEFLSKVESTGMSVNYVPLAGHVTTRTAVMGEDFKRRATSAEIEAMKVHVEEAMQSGAWGLSNILEPGPTEYAAFEEVVELARVAAKYGGRYVPHTRHIQSSWPTEDPKEYRYGIYHGPLEDIFVGRYRGYMEAIEVSRRAGLPLHIAHMAPAFHIPQPHPDYLEEAMARATLDIIDQARDEGLQVTFDTIPCSSTVAGEGPVNAFLHRWVESLGDEGFIAGLKRGDLRDDIKRVRDAGGLKAGMIHTKADPYWGDCFTVLSCANDAYVAKTIGELAGGFNDDPLDVVFDILVEDPAATWAQTLDRRMTEPVLKAFLRHEVGMPCTDMAPVGGVDHMLTKDTARFGARPPAIAYGLYPHYIDKFVKEAETLTLEEAIHKATYLPAKTFGLEGRGILAPGAFADIVLFDFEKIRMKGDMRNPVQAPSGIEHVLVNGQVVYQGSSHTGARPGKVLRRT